MTPARLYTREEVAQYKDKKEAVFIIDNVVYDVSKFLDEHPGGHEVLVNEIGKDASEDFEDVGHSVDAKELMVRFAVGELVPAERVERARRAVTWDAAGPEQSTGFFASWKFPVLLGVLVTVLYTYVFG